MLVAATAIDQGLTEVFTRRGDDEYFDAFRDIFTKALWLCGAE
jgi:hypothetical protein